jgi:hypothetical protein
VTSLSFRLTTKAALAHTFIYEFDKKKPTPERLSKAVETVEQAYKYVAPL